MGSSDTLFDVGCGDGRILIAAVKDFGAKKAVGFEMRDDLYRQAVQEVSRQGLEDRISIINNDVFTGNLSEATVITLYLTTTGNEKLKPKLAEGARQWTRIVSHDLSKAGVRQRRRLSTATQSACTPSQTLNFNNEACPSSKQSSQNSPP